ncbi:CD225/dispanin family protein [Streptomyces sp. NPDC057743]|uniref:CD225/dispanin family protein n=1 Tax=Streptomyces sp. NPDC057743 TaxID=3346236 RepID=UPI003677438B
MNDTWTCGNCGSEEPAGTWRCSRCGNVVRPDYSGEWPTRPPPPAPAPPPPPPPPAAPAVPQSQAPWQGHQPPGPLPNSHLVWAIVSIFFFWPLGIAAVIFAAQVKSKYTVGDYAGALDSSNKARLFSLIATIVFAVSVLLVIIFVIVMWPHGGPPQGPPGPPEGPSGPSY